MVSEDRRLRLTGYEVYRFGRAEFAEPPRTANALDEFFDELLSDETRPHLWPSGCLPITRERDTPEIHNVG